MSYKDYEVGALLRMNKIALYKRIVLITGIIVLVLLISVVAPSMIMAFIATFILLLDYDKNCLPRSRMITGTLYILATLAFIFYYLTALPYREWVSPSLILLIAGIINYRVWIAWNAKEAFKKNLI